MTTLVVADDHPFVRQGVRTVLESQPAWQVVGEAADGWAALALVERLQPDILIVDVMLPGLNGLEVTRRVRTQVPGTAVVVLSMHAHEPYVLEALRAGAGAYVLKATATDSLLEAVRTVRAGGRYLSPPLTERAIDAYLGTASAAGLPLDSYKLLTAREREVFQLAAEGLVNSEIAARLNISPRTAETHRTNIGRKMGLTTPAEWRVYAQERGLLPPD